MYVQLKLWGVWIDIAAKLREEKHAGVQVFYHFCGTPLPMFKQEIRG